MTFTDEKPSTCSLFVEKGGLKLMVQGLKVYKNILFWKMANKLKH